MDKSSSKKDLNGIFYFNRRLLNLYSDSYLILLNPILFGIFDLITLIVQIRKNKAFKYRIDHSDQRLNEKGSKDKDKNGEFFVKINIGP